MSKKSPNVINKQSGLHSSHNKTAEVTVQLASSYYITKPHSKQLSTSII